MAFATLSLLALAQLAVAAPQVNPPIMPCERDTEWHIDNVEQYRVGPREVSGITCESQEDNSCSITHGYTHTMYVPLQFSYKNPLRLTAHEWSHADLEQWRERQLGLEFRAQRGLRRRLQLQVRNTKRRPLLPVLEAHD